MSKMTRFFCGAVFATALFLGVGALSPQAAQATSLTSSQISAIIGLLQSFGADQTTINNVQTTLGGTSTGGGTQPWCHTFNIDLTFGSIGTEVSELNHALKSSGIAIAEDTRTFNEDTAASVVQFQAKYGIRQTGYVGPITRAKLNKLYGCSNPVPPSTFSASPTSGGAPLAVMFYSNTQSGTVNFGDGTPSTSMECDNISVANSSSVSSACLRTFTSHTYTTPGIYTATLQIPPPCTANQNDPTFSSSSCFPVTIGKVTITVTGGTVQPLTVLSPNGGEVWQKGIAQRITWTPRGNTCPAGAYCIRADETVDIHLELYSPSCTVNCPLYAQIAYIIAKQVSDTGAFEWGVGKTIDGKEVPDGKYLVKITKSGTDVSDSSDAPFSIVAPGTIVVPIISSLQPTSGSVGTQVILTGSGFATSVGTGFGPANTIRFNNFYASGIASKDGATLMFTVPSQLMNCSGDVCTNVYLPVTPGTYGVSVMNANGTSNTVDFTVTSKTGALSINPTSAGIIKVGGTTEFQAMYQPPMPSCSIDLACPQVMPNLLPVRATWTSSDPKVATVAYKEIPCPAGSYCFAQQFDYLTAVATAISLGSATITAAYKDSSGAVFTASAPVSTVMQ